MKAEENGMTDKEKLLALLAEWGIEPRQQDDARHFGVPVDEVTLMAKEGGVGGYTDFQAIFSFGREGDFYAVDIWE